MGAAWVPSMADPKKKKKNKINKRLHVSEETR